LVFHATSKITQRERVERAKGRKGEWATGRKGKRILPRSGYTE
jgi:hypothetical protein